MHKETFCKAVGISAYYKRVDFRYVWNMYIKYKIQASYGRCWLLIRVSRELQTNTHLLTNEQKITLILIEYI